MSRNQLLVIVGLILVLGVAFQHSPARRSAQHDTCSICPRWVMWVLPGIGPRWGQTGAVDTQAEQGRRVLEQWLPTPAPLLPVPTPTPLDAARFWNSHCRNC